MDGGAKTFTAYKYFGTRGKEELKSLCKAECSAWDSCEAVMDFSPNSPRNATAALGICHIFFGADDASAARSKWKAPNNPLKRTTAGGQPCTSGALGCWLGLFQHYPEPTCEKMARGRTRITTRAVATTQGVCLNFGADIVIRVKRGRDP